MIEKKEITCSGCGKTNWIPEKNEDGNDIQPHYHRFVRVKTSKKPTLTQARKIQVVVFDKQMTRDLKNVQ